MGKFDKILEKILLGKSDSNIPFSDLCYVMKKLGFEERIRSSHHIFAKSDIEDIVNIQPLGSKAKSYQIKQVREIILRYKLEKTGE